MDNTRLKADTLSRRMGAGRTPGNRTAAAGELSAAEIVTTVRRLGFVLHKAHEIMLGNLIRHSNHGLAETLNDTLKPLADLLVHFELGTGRDTPEGDDVP